MFSLLFVLSIVICVVSYIFGIVKKKENMSWLALILIIIFGLFSGFSFMVMFDCLQVLGTAHTIDEKIEMYQEENAEIEQTIETIVKDHMNYEKETYTEIIDESVVELVFKIPELKSDQLVLQQTEVFVNNKAQIKALKEEKIDVAKARWNLYFGK